MYDITVVKFLFTSSFVAYSFQPYLNDFDAISIALSTDSRVASITEGQPLTQRIRCD